MISKECFKVLVVKDPRLCLWAANRCQLGTYEHVHSKLTLWSSKLKWVRRGTVLLPPKPSSERNSSSESSARSAKYSWRASWIVTCIDNWKRNLLLSITTTHIRRNIVHNSSEDIHCDKDHVLKTNEQPNCPNARERNNLGSVAENARIGDDWDHSR